jgi:hypothetical protein
MANTEFSNKLNAALRYGGTTAGTLFAVMGALSLLSTDQVAALKTDIETLKTSILTGYGALINMGVILGPVAIGVLAKVGYSSSSVKSMAGKLLRIAANAADPSSTDAKVAIVNAAASKTVGGSNAAVLASPELANNPATADNVIASSTVTS